MKRKNSKYLTVRLAWIQELIADKEAAEIKMQAQIDVVDRIKRDIVALKNIVRSLTTLI